MNLNLYICIFSVDVVIWDGKKSEVERRLRLIFSMRGIFRPSVSTFAAKVLSLSLFLFCFVFNCQVVYSRKLYSGSLINNTRMSAWRYFECSFEPVLPPL